MGGAKLRRNLRPGPEKRREFARCALVAAAGAAMATAMKASTSQTMSQARGDVWRDATKAATRAVMPMATPPQPGIFFQAEDGIRDLTVTGVQTCALPI